MCAEEKSCSFKPTLKWETSNRALKQSLSLVLFINAIKHTVGRSVIADSSDTGSYVCMYHPLDHQLLTNHLIGQQRMHQSHAIICTKQGLTKE